jgi:hypothetical protein
VQALRDRYHWQADGAVQVDNDLCHTPDIRIRTALYRAADNAIRSLPGQMSSGYATSIDLNSLLRSIWLTGDLVSGTVQPALLDVHWLQHHVAQFNSNGSEIPQVEAPPLPLKVAIMMLPCFRDAHDDVGKPVRTLTASEVLQSSLDVADFRLYHSYFAHLHEALVEHNSIVQHFSTVVSGACLGKGSDIEARPKLPVGDGDEPIAYADLGDHHDYSHGGDGDGHGDMEDPSSCPVATNDGVQCGPMVWRIPRVGEARCAPVDASEVYS